MFLQQKLLIVTALAALIGLAMVTRAPVVAASPHRAKPRVGASVATYLAVIAVALMLVGVVSRTLIRHVVQIAPLVLAR
jgi:cell division protein FtsW (lipid II flippase)